MGQWHHAVFTFGPDGMALYIDGRLVDTNLYGGGLGATSGGLGNYEPIALGAAAWNSGDRRITPLRAHFSGVLDDVRLYDYDLSGTEAAWLYEQGMPDDPQAPQLVALYEFDETVNDPVLTGHWRLDDAGAGGGGMAADDRLRLSDRAIVDSYDSSLGPYGGANVSSRAAVSTNATSNDVLVVASNAQLSGDAYCGVGGDPAIAMQINGLVSGTRSSMSTNVFMPANGAPSGMPASQGNKVYLSNRTWNSDQKFKSLSLLGNCTVWVVGDVRVQCTGTLLVRNRARIVVPAGSSLTIHARRNVYIDD